MSIAISLQYNDGFLPDIMLLTLSVLLLPFRIPIKPHEEDCPCSLYYTSPRKTFDSFPPLTVLGGWSEGTDASRFFFEVHRRKEKPA